MAGTSLHTKPFTHYCPNPLFAPALLRARDSRCTEIAAVRDKNYGGEFQSANSFLASAADGVRKRQPVSEGVADGHIPAAPWRVFDSRTRVLVLLREKLLLIGVQCRRLNSHGGSGTAIAVVLGEMQDAFVLRNLHVQRQTRFEAVLPVDLETKKLDVKLLRLALVEDAKDRRCSSQPHPECPF